MPELRQNFFTKEWVIIATERAKRPEELATHRPAQTVPAYLESCPFCPGNESKTPPEVLRFPANSQRAVGGARDSQQVRRACRATAQPTRSLQHLWRRIEGFGFHEVIIDSPDHSRCMALLPDAHVANILARLQRALQLAEHGPSRQPCHDFQESRRRCRRQHAASAFAIDCDPGDSEPGAPPPARGSAPLRRRRRMHVLPHGGT